MSSFIDWPRVLELGTARDTYGYVNYSLLLLVYKELQRSYYFAHKPTPLDLTTSENPVLEVALFKADASIPVNDIPKAVESLVKSIKAGGNNTIHAPALRDDHVTSLLVSFYALHFRGGGEADYCIFRLPGPRSRPTIPTKKRS